MNSKLIDYINFISHVITANFIFATLSYGQLANKNLNLLQFKYVPILLLLGGLQTIIMMNTAVIGKKTIKLSLVTIQLLIIVTGYIMMLCINKYFVNQSIFTISDLLGFILILLAIFIGERYNKCD